jgi:heterodisulfide reductase subunit B
VLLPALHQWCQQLQQQQRQQQQQQPNQLLQACASCWLELDRQQPRLLLLLLRPAAQAPVLLASFAGHLLLLTWVVP